MEESPIPTTGTQELSLTDRAVALLTKHYIPYVKEAVLWLETYSGKRSKRCVHELRNALDHLAIALHENTTEVDALKSLNAVEEHFRRAAVEPVEFIALEEAQRLLKIKEYGFWWWKFLLLKPVDTEEFNRKLHEGQRFIEQGRHFKGVSLTKSYVNFKNGYTVFHQLLDEVKPAELRTSLFAVLLVFVGWVLSGQPFYLLGRLWFGLWYALRSL